jgi:hypothetical protein
MVGCTAGCPARSLGTVALAGASDLQDALDNLRKAGLPILNGLIAFWIYGDLLGRFPIEADG